MVDSGQTGEFIVLNADVQSCASPWLRTCGGTPSMETWKGGGVTARPRCLSPNAFIGSSQSHMISMRCRTFNATAGGYMRGDGCSGMKLDRTEWWTCEPSGHHSQLYRCCLLLVISGDHGPASWIYLLSNCCWLLLVIVSCCISDNAVISELSTSQLPNCRLTMLNGCSWLAPRPGPWNLGICRRNVTPFGAAPWWVRMESQPRWQLPMESPRRTSPPGDPC